MKYDIKECSPEEAEFISDKLLEFNLSKILSSFMAVVSYDKTW